MNNIRYLLYVALLCCFTEVVGMDIIRKTQNIHVDFEINNQHTVGTKDLDISFDQERYAEIMKDVQKKWREYREKYSELCYECLNAELCSPCDLFKNIYYTEQLLAGSRQCIDELIKYRDYWKLIGLFLKYSKIENDYEVDTQNVVEIIDVIQNVLSNIIKNKEILNTNHEIGISIIEILESQEENLVKQIILYLYNKKILTQN